MLLGGTPHAQDCHLLNAKRIVVSDDVSKKTWKPDERYIAFFKHL